MGIANHKYCILLYSHPQDFLLLVSDVACGDTWISFKGGAGYTLLSLSISCEAAFCLKPKRASEMTHKINVMGCFLNVLFNSVLEYLGKNS